jgi:hypothetical protein
MISLRCKHSAAKSAPVLFLPAVLVTAWHEMYKGEVPPVLC